MVEHSLTNSKVPKLIGRSVLMTSTTSQMIIMGLRAFAISICESKEINHLQLPLNVYVAVHREVSISWGTRSGKAR